MASSFRYFLWNMSSCRCNEGTDWCLYFLGVLWFDSVIFIFVLQRVLSECSAAHPPPAHCEHFKLLLLNLMFYFGFTLSYIIIGKWITWVTIFTRVKYGSQLFSNTLIMLFHFFHLLPMLFFFPVSCVCTKCWCWSYVFSALAFFSYCLPTLFGSSSSQPVCYFLSLLKVYICVSLSHHCTNGETP